MTWLLIETFLLMLSAFFLGALVACLVKSTFFGASASDVVIAPAQREAEPALATAGRAPAEAAVAAPPARPVPAPDLVRPKIETVTRPETAPPVPVPDAQRFERALKEQTAAVTPPQPASPTAARPAPAPAPAPAAPQVVAPAPAPAPAQAPAAPVVAAPSAPAVAASAPAVPPTAAPLPPIAVSPAEPLKAPVAPVAEKAPAPVAVPAPAPVSRPVAPAAADVPKVETPAAKPAEPARAEGATAAAAAAGAAIAAAAALSAARSQPAEAPSVEPKPAEPKPFAIMPAASGSSGQGSVAAQVSMGPAVAKPAPAAPLSPAPVAPPSPVPVAPPVAAPRALDDLKRIRGIDADMERRLHALGITSYAEIAAWSARDVGRIGDALDIRSRIGRQGWIEQAQVLAKGGLTDYARFGDRLEPALSRPTADQGQPLPPQPVAPASAVAAAAAAAAAVVAAARLPEAAPPVVAAKAAEAAPAAPVIAKVEAAPAEKSVPAALDDLKRIRAVDADLERRLNGLGVTSYADIAGWTSGDVRRISDALALGDRIPREGWIEQAQVLARGGLTDYARRGVSGAPLTTPGTFTSLPVAAVPAATDVSPVQQPVTHHSTAASEPELLPFGVRRPAPVDATVPAPAVPSGAHEEAVPPPKVDHSADANDPKPAPPDDDTDAAEPGKASAPAERPAAASQVPFAELPRSGAQAAAAAAAAIAAAAAASSRARVAAPAPAPEADARDDLQRILGVGAEAERLLNVHGVTRYAEIAGWSAADIARFDGLFGAPGRISRENWIEQAALLASGGRTAYARRDDAALRPAEPETPRPARLADAIRENALKAPDRPDDAPAARPPPSQRPDLSSLRSIRSEALRGEAAVAAPDDLKRIRGIGVLIEKKLNSLGIASYDQVANWTQADVDRVSQILDFKGRIERENWVEQARILASGGQTEFSRRVDKGDA